MFSHPFRTSMLTLVLCAAASLPSTASALNVVATLPDLAALAQDVGAPHVEVEVLAAPTQDPHYVDPKPSLILPLNRADLLLLNGLGLEEGWLPPLLTNARNSDIIVGAPGHFDASSFVSVLEVPTGKVDRSMGDVHGGGNPHYTFDPRAAAAIAEALGEKMASLEPEHAEDFVANGQRVAKELREFAAEHTRRFASLPNRRIVSYHKSLSYLVDWLGLDAVHTVEPLPGVPPNPAHVAKVLKGMRALKVRALVQEEHHPTSTSRTLARLGQAKLVIIPTATRFTKGQQYIDHIRSVTAGIHDALSN